MSNSFRFLLYHQGALGDFVLALPILESLHFKFPKARFTIVASNDNLGLIASRPYLEKAVSRDLSCLAILFQDAPSDMRNLERILEFPFDLAFLFGQSNLPTLAKNISLQGVGTVYQISSFPGAHHREHVTDFLYRQFSRQGLSLPKKKAVVDPLEAEKRRGTDYAGYLLKNFKEIVVLHPGSGSRKKIWPLKYWKALMALFERNNQIATVMLSGPADGEITAKLLRNDTSMRLHMVKNWSLPEVVGLLEKASLYMGNDSGISHLAAAVGVSSIVIFGPSDPRVWGPRGENVTIVRETWSYPENMLLEKNSSEVRIPDHVINAIKSAMSPKDPPSLIPTA